MMEFYQLRPFHMVTDKVRPGFVVGFGGRGHFHPFLVVLP